MKKIILIIIGAILAISISVYSFFPRLFTPKHYKSVEKVLSVSNKNRIDARVLDMENLGSFTALDSAQVLWKIYESNPAQFQYAEQYKKYDSMPEHYSLGVLYRVKARINDQTTFFYVVMRKNDVVSILSELP